jgi:hypothetical protein
MTIGTVIPSLPWGGGGGGGETNYQLRKIMQLHERSRLLLTAGEMLMQGGSWKRTNNFLNYKYVICIA